MQRGTAESFGMGVSARLPEAIGVVHISESSSQTPPPHHRPGYRPAVRPAGSAPGNRVLYGQRLGVCIPLRPGLGRPAPVPAATNFCGPADKPAARGWCSAASCVSPGKVQARPKGSRSSKTPPPPFPPLASPLPAACLPPTHTHGKRGAWSPLPSFAETARSYRHLVSTRGLRRARVAPQQSPARS